MDELLFNYQQHMPNASFIVVHMHKLAEEEINNTILRNINMTKLDPDIKVLRDLYLENNKSQQQNLTLKLAQMRLGYEQTITQPNPRTSKKVLQLESRTLTFRHYYHLLEGIFIIF